MLIFRRCRSSTSAGIQRRIVELLANVLQRSGAHGLEADQQARAAAARHELHQLVIAADQAGRQPKPLDLERHQRGEQLARVGAVGDEIEVDEDEAARTELADVGDHVFHRLLQLLASPGGRRHAELAVMRAGTRGFEHRLREVVALAEQFAPRERHAGQVQPGHLHVAAAQRATRKVAQQLGPGLLRVAGADRVGMLLGLVGQQRDMRTAEHHLDAAPPVVSRELVGAHGTAGDHRHADEVRVEIARHIAGALVDTAGIARPVPAAPARRAWST